MYALDSEKLVNGLIRGSIPLGNVGLVEGRQNSSGSGSNVVAVGKSLLERVPIVKGRQTKIET